ncbi:hypothetical protein [Aquimarina longa]|uniref:hypothetical protein n=1 Tax=Aquimarina longa TaxID=1080221 RepID=UPI00078464A8|nr:hypothetical protein [Aquimarina longa]
MLHIIFVLEIDYELYAIALKYREDFYSIAFDIQELCCYGFKFLLVIWSYILIKKIIPFDNEIDRGIERAMLFLKK